MSKRRLCGKLCAWYRREFLGKIEFIFSKTCKIIEDKDKMESTKRSQTENNDDSEGSVRTEEPHAKRTKTCDDTEEKYLPVRMNEVLNEEDVMDILRNHWIDGKNCKISKCDTILKTDPFKIGIVQNFLAGKEVVKEIVKEIHEVKWNRKQMDLYEFYQSDDLSNIESQYLSNFFKFLKDKVMPWMEKLCCLKLSYVSATCSMYNCGDYLLPHDDLLNDRQVAFVFYMTPWDCKKKWTEDMGGCLEIFSTDSDGLPQYPVVDKICPKNNQFVFFKVGTKSYHQVGEVTNFNFPRLTINGWFHGEVNGDVSNRIAATKIYKSPASFETVLENWIRSIYLKASTKKDIQNVIEDQSEICSDQFLVQSMYEKITKELLSNKTFSWSLKGPANMQKYEILDLTTAEGLVKDCYMLFISQQMFKLLHEYTDLDLYGRNAEEPSCYLEIQRWQHGSYTILGEGSNCEGGVLDVMLYLNAKENVGVITYLTPEDPENEYDSEEGPVLLTISPKSNALNIVYPSEGASKFTKYVSKKTPIDEYVYIITCSYKE